MKVFILIQQTVVRGYRKLPQFSRKINIIQTFSSFSFFLSFCRAHDIGILRCHITVVIVGRVTASTHVRDTAPRERLMRITKYRI